MKKLLILVLSIATTGLFTVPSFATVTKTASSGGSIQLGGGPTVDLSANVSARYASGGTAYSADTCNSKGTQEYGGASDTTYLYYKDVGTGKSPDALTNGNSLDVNGWTKIGG